MTESVGRTGHLHDISGITYEYIELIVCMQCGCNGRIQ